MARNGSGSYSLPAGNPVTTGTQITATWGNTTMADIAAELTASVAADGQTPITGPLKYPAGSVSAPAVTFSAETNTGFYRSASSVVSLAIAGSQKYIFGASAVTLAGSASITGTEFGYLTGVTSAIQTQLAAKQPLDADLTAIAALANTDGNFIVGNGSAWVAESGATARASIGSNDAANITTGDLAAARIATALNATGSAPFYVCRAWVRLDGTGTPAITEDGNVSSITDNGTGNYSINFATALPDANYAVSGCAIAQGANGVGSTVVEIHDSAAPTASVLRIYVKNASSGALTDFSIVTVAVFR